MRSDAHGRNPPEGEVQHNPSQRINWSSRQCQIAALHHAASRPSSGADAGRHDDALEQRRTPPRRRARGRSRRSRPRRPRRSGGCRCPMKMNTPSVPRPTKPAIVAVAITWLAAERTPAMISGSALGTSTCHSACMPVRPIPVAASRTSAGDAVDAGRGVEHDRRHGEDDQGDEHRPQRQRPPREQQADDADGRDRPPQAGEVGGDEAAAAGVADRQTDREADHRRAEQGERASTRGARARLRRCRCGPTSCRRWSASRSRRGSSSRGDRSAPAATASPAARRAQTTSVERRGPGRRCDERRPRSRRRCCRSRPSANRRPRPPRPTQRADADQRHRAHRRQAQAGDDARQGERQLDGDEAARAAGSPCRRPRATHRLGAPNGPTRRCCARG